MSYKKDIASPLIIESIDSPVIIAQAAHNNAPTDIADLDSRLVYMNKKASKLNNFPKTFNPEGRYYRELPVSWAEYADSYEKQNKLSEQKRSPIMVLSMHELGKEKKMTSYLGITHPVFNTKGQVIGTQYEALLFNASLLQRYFIIERPPLMHLNPPTEQFTKRELEVIFFMLQGLSAKEIAQRMNLCYRTIENKLQIIYRKVDVNNLKQLREYCRNFGFQNYIPPRLVQVGVSFL